MSTDEQRRFPVGSIIFDSNSSRFFILVERTEEKDFWFPNSAEVSMSKPFTYSDAAVSRYTFFDD